MAFTLNPRIQHSVATRAGMNTLQHRTRSVLFSSVAPNQQETSAPDRKYVVIHKNKQSMNFRNGSPLVFSGSVEKTISADESSGIPMGSLVGIVVSNKQEKRPASKRGGSNRGRGGKGRNEKTKTKIDYSHYVVDKDEGTAQQYNADGEKLSMVEDISDIQKSISEGKLIGFGFFNPVSMYRAFIFCHQANYPSLFKEINAMFKNSDAISDREKTEKVIEMVMITKIEDAIRSRMFLNLPSTSTDSYRLINGEGDGLSGLAVDVLGGKVAVIMASASWVEIYKETIMKVLTDVLASHPIYGADEEANLDIVWRNTPMRLKQDGYEFPEITEAEEEEQKQRVENNTPVILTENNIKYYTYPYNLSSQKTGFYCDQRDNRLNLAKHCENKRVLDLCCYNGGFALNSIIHGGASSCIGVDSSQDAVDAATENAKLNGLDSDIYDFVKEDIGKYMKEAEEEGEEFDVIILDPPKLAPTVTALERASRKYHSLNRDAIKLINSKEGGLLLTCTCSGAMTQKNGGQFFLETIKGAALSAGRRITLLRSSGAAPCHVQCPASFPANAYLTAALFYISPEGE
jgi:23S rRNA G2069 N7-methylase RlmK/C1962 C5-methylase RlmI